MKATIIQVWQDSIRFENKLNEIIQSKEKYYEIIDIKYSIAYDNTNKKQCYSALLLYKEIELKVYRGNDIYD